MSWFFDWLPIVLFYAIYQYGGIYLATASMMVCMVCMLLYQRYQQGFIEQQTWMTSALILSLGTATLLFRNPMFIKWKPTAIYWALAACILGVDLIKRDNLVERLLTEHIQLSEGHWHRLSQGTIGFLITLGALNLYIAYHYPTSTWVAFKLFGTMLLTLSYAGMVALYVYRYGEMKNESTTNHD